MIPNQNRSIRCGYVDMFDVTIRKVLNGTTTVEEAMRVLGSARRAGA